MAAKRTAADRERAADIRAWAAGQGLRVAAQGRIPAAVEQAYPGPGWQQQAPPDDPGPDWATAAAQLGVQVDGLNLDQPFPGDLGNGAGWLSADPVPGEPGTFVTQPAWGVDLGADPGGGGPSAPEGPPPPASLQEARDQLGPPPGQVLPPWAGTRGRGSDQRPPPAPGPPKLTNAQRGEIAGNWALLLSMPATALAMIDPACGGALADNIDTIISKSLPLVYQSGTAVKFLSEAGEWLLWYGLGQACLPVLTMAWSHHVTHTVMVVNGQVVAATRDPAGRIVPASPQAQAQEQDWSAYGTEVPGHVPPVRPV